MKFFLGLIPLAALCLVQEITAQEYNYNYQLGAPSPYGAQPQYAPAAPVYTAKPSYGPVYAGPAKSYTYPSPSPPVPCPTNLLLSCAPSVAPVPCQSVSYASAPSYSAPAKSSYSAPPSPSYR